ncbi:MAG: tRNA uridine-5-carboxymethylaminomethyl(34) synthesis enzyme MnmG [candidate division FCPU426 bacterium]
MNAPEYDIIVVGGGHAGIEAAAAASRMQCRVLLVTLKLDQIGALSCNPAIGGVGKGQLVKEIDALGGLMGELADAACLQYRRLNRSRGAAVQSTRMQVDLEEYPRLAQARLRALPGLDLAEDEAVDLLAEQGRVAGVRLARAGAVTARAVVLAAGTFFHGLIHIGFEQQRSGRLGDPASDRLPDALAALGVKLGRFKTGTTPRLDGRSIDFDRLTEQPGDPVFDPYSNRSPREPRLAQRPCYLGRTNLRTHELIRANLSRSALYGGQITATGVRYCPSVEDKIVKFPDQDHHHVFVEPETLSTERYYPNGLSNSLPADVQLEVVRSVAGLERAVIVQNGYGIEHDYLLPTQLSAGLESALLPGLFCAGQLNGTTGYEEAAAQGLMAGLNAVRRIRGEAAVALKRSEAYIGVLIDDLVFKGTNEPYRMFTSRVEYRLLLREDNAEERLTPLARQLGLVDEKTHADFQRREEALKQELLRLRQTRIAAGSASAAVLARFSSAPLSESATLEELLRRPELEYAALAELDPATAQVPRLVQERAEVAVKYEGYLKRQAAQVEDLEFLEQVRVPEGFVYQGLPGLSREVVEKLTALKPQNLGQASRISGVTPAALSQLLYRIKKG